MSTRKTPQGPGRLAAVASGRDPWGPRRTGPGRVSEPRLVRPHPPVETRSPDVRLGRRTSTKVDSDSGPKGWAASRLLEGPPAGPKGGSSDATGSRRPPSHGECTTVDEATASKQMSLAKCAPLIRPKCTSSTPSAPKFCTDC